MIKVGDIVYFYFCHAFCVPGVIHELSAVERFTGKMEMRCRPARVIAMNPIPDPTGIPALDHQASIRMKGRLQAHLDVEFNDDDRTLLPGGVGRLMSKEQKHVMAHNGPDGPGRLNKSWPAHGTWADKPMPVAD